MKYKPEVGDKIPDAYGSLATPTPDQLSRWNEGLQYISNPEGYELYKSLNENKNPAEYYILQVIPSEDEWQEVLMMSMQNLNIGAFIRHQRATDKAAQSASLRAQELGSKR